MGRRRKNLPEEPVELEITALGPDGAGRAVHDGRSLKVFGALPGERVMARYLFGRHQRGRADTLEVLEPSGDRTEPRCPHFGYCSACSSQHVSLDAQHAWKQEALLACLADQGNVRPVGVYAPLSGAQWNYRRKARLSVRHVAAKGRVLVGFRERNGRYVADMDTCHVLRKEIADALPALSSLLGSLDCRATVPQIEVACGDEVSALVIRHMEPLSGHDTEQLTAFAGQTGLGIYLQPAGPDSIRLLAPEGLQLEYAINALSLRFRFEPLDFIQVNGSVNQAMVSRALELLEPCAEDRILDLFCGLGNFTLPLAKHAGHVFGIEGSEEMVGRARENARLNGCANVEFLAADLYEQGSGATMPAIRFDKVLLDPPRSGAEPLLPWIAESRVGRVLYISCNPATLARDADILVNRHGYTLAGAGIIDMFPHTPHSEAIALFEREWDAVAS